MQLICKHDPSDPNHLICESKDSPMRQWFHKRYRQFYCVGPTCPPHKAYTHLWVDLVLAILVVSLLLSNVVFVIKGRRVDTEKRDVLQEQIDKAVADVPRPPEPTPPPEEPFSSQAFLLQGKVVYFSSEGEQLGRGPWPPKVGETTKVKVFLKVEAADGPILGVVVSGRLGQGVEWTGFAPLARRLSYVPEGRTVEWYPQDDLSVVFEVAIRPTQDQVETGAMVVLEDVSLRGRIGEGGSLQKIQIPDLVLSFQ